MTPHTFRPGQLSAESAAALSEMSRRLAGLDRLSVAPPLALARQGYDGQPVVYLDTSGLGGVGYPPQLEEYLASSTPLTSATNVAQAVMTLTLTAGKWLVFYQSSAIIQTTAAGDYIWSYLTLSSGSVFPAAAVQARVYVTGLPSVGTAGGFARVDAGSSGVTVNLNFVRTFVGTVTSTTVYGGSSVPGFQTYMGATRVEF
jgi:hypothetical protein